jgi:ABC-type histidine transport system ATPase subunit
MDEGQWIEEGPPEKIFTNPAEERSRQFFGACIVKPLNETVQGL